MSITYSRRDLLRQMSAFSAVLLSKTHATPEHASSNLPSEIRITPISKYSFRLSVVPLRDGSPVPIPFDGSLLQESWGTPAAVWRGEIPAKKVVCGDLQVEISNPPLRVRVVNAKNAAIQELTLADDGSLGFVTGDGPLLGLGEGGPQFDRRGSTDAMISGQGGYHLHTHGGRVPIPWLIGTSGWAIYIHQPFGTFDLSGAQGKFRPKEPGVPLDIFVIGTGDPAAILAEYARL